MKRLKKLFIGLLSSIAIIGFLVGSVYASNNVVRTLTSASTGSTVRASASIRVSPNANSVVSGIAARASVSTGAATNWARHAPGHNLPGNTNISSTTVTSTSPNASATGQFEYRQQTNSSWIRLPNLNRAH